MKIFLILTFVTIFPFNAFSVENVDNFFSSKNIITTVYFKSGSSHLSAIDKEKLEYAINKVKLIDRSRYVVRIEGFVKNGSSKDEKLRSFALSKKIADYLHDKSDYKLNIYLTGFSVDKYLDQQYPDRVDVVSYEKVVDIDRTTEDELITDITTQR